MERLINKILEHRTKDLDIYKHNGSTWLIFTDERKWVVELTSSGTLWYNYYFFKKCFGYLSLDVVENQHYITKWVEDTVINRVNPTLTLSKDNTNYVEDVIQKGVKETNKRLQQFPDNAEDTIQNGVKETRGLEEWVNNEEIVNKTIQNGVKHTEYGDWEDGDERLDDIIKYGVKTTQSGILFDESKVDTVIVEGVKEIRSKGVSESQVNRIIKNGIKEVQPLPAQDGNRDWGLYYQGQEDRTKPHTEYVKDVIKDSIPMFKLVYNPNDFSPNRIEEDLREKVDKVLVDGIKETNWRRVDNFPEFEERVIKGGTKI